MPVVVPSGLPDSVRSARVVAIVPARYQSTRFPGKPLASIDGRPMVEHVCRRAEAAASVDAVLVATDDERIASAVDAFGGTAVLTRADHASGTDRLAEVASHLDAAVVVNVQGDEPLIAPEAIDAAVRPMLATTGADIGTLRRSISDPAELANPGVVKVTVDRHGLALYFSRSPIPFVRTGVPAPPVWAHLGLYVYRRDVLARLAALEPTPLELAEGLEQLRALEHGFRILTVETTGGAIGVDTPEDLERVRQHMATGGAGLAGGSLRR